MSQWTHVNASIRFDGVRGLTPPPELGWPCRWEDTVEVMDACNVPCGSEGSLEWSLHTNPASDSLARWTASIWGDLRGYDNVREIESYLARIVKDRPIRSGVAEIVVEHTSTTILRYDTDQRKWVRVSEVLDHDTKVVSAEDQKEVKP